MVHMHMQAHTSSGDLAWQFEPVRNKSPGCVLCLWGGCDKGFEVFDRHWPWARSALVKDLCNAAITAHKSTSLHLSVDYSEWFIGADLALWLFLNWWFYEATSFSSRGPSDMAADKIYIYILLQWLALGCDGKSIYVERAAKCVSFYTTFVLTEQKQSSLSGLFAATWLLQNISFSGTEMMNPQERHICYWILIMYTTSLYHPSKPWKCLRKNSLFWHPKSWKIGWFFGCSA